MKFSVARCKNTRSRYFRITMVYAATWSRTSRRGREPPAHAPRPSDSRWENCGGGRSRVGEICEGETRARTRCEAGREKIATRLSHNVDTNVCVSSSSFIWLIYFIFNFTWIQFYTKISVKAFFLLFNHKSLLRSRGVERIIHVWQCTILLFTIRYF